MPDNDTTKGETMGLEEDLVRLQTRHEELRYYVHQDLAPHVRRLDADIAEIKITLGKTATHDDILGLHQKIDGSINELLKDALNAVPKHAAERTARNGVIWAAVCALATCLCAGIAALALAHR